MAAMKQLLLLNLLLFLLTRAQAQATREISSPNGSIRLVAYVHDQLRYSVYFGNRLIVSPSEIDMVLADGRKLSGGLAKPQFAERNVSETIISPVPEKRRHIPDRYKELKITLRNAFAVIFRVYDDGVAYRIATSFPGGITVRSETAAFRFPANHPGYLPYRFRRTVHSQTA
jgi:alpha-glucosidase